MWIKYRFVFWIDGQAKPTWSLKTIEKLVMFLYITVGNSNIESELKVQCEQKGLDSYRWMHSLAWKVSATGCDSEEKRECMLAVRVLLLGCQKHFYLLCKLRYRLWINNKKASLILLHFGFQDSCFSRTVSRLWKFHIPLILKYGMWSVLS